MWSLAQCGRCLRRSGAALRNPRERAACRIYAAYLGRRWWRGCIRRARQILGRPRPGPKATADGHPADAGAGCRPSPEQLPPPVAPPSENGGAA